MKIRLALPLATVLLALALPSVAFAVDTRIVFGPEGDTPKTKPMFVFGSSEPATFQCSLDGAAFKACPTPYTVGPLKPGRHTLRVRAVDVNGIPDATPDSRSFRVRDPYYPKLKLGKVKKSGRTIKVKIAASDRGTAKSRLSIRCRLDKGRTKKCGSSVVYRKVKRGRHKLTVSVTDPGGNKTTKTARFRV